MCKYLRAFGSLFTQAHFESVAHHPMQFIHIKYNRESAATLSHGAPVLAKQRNTRSLSVCLLVTIESQLRCEPERLFK